MVEFYLNTTHSVFMAQRVSHTTVITILGITYRPVFYLKHKVSETEFSLRFCLRRQTGSFCLAPLSRLQLKTETESSRRNVVFYIFYLIIAFLQSTQDT
jgi:hypothetical protein